MMLEVVPATVSSLSDIWVEIIVAGVLLLIIAFLYWRIPKEEVKD